MAIGTQARRLAVGSGRLAGGFLVMEQDRNQSTSKRKTNETKLPLLGSKAKAGAL